MNRPIVIDIHLKEAKRVLYSLLLNIGNKHITSNEVDIMYNLSKDSQIKEILDGGKS